MHDKSLCCVCHSGCDVHMHNKSLCLHFKPARLYVFYFSDEYTSPAAEKLFIRLVKGWIWHSWISTFALLTANCAIFETEINDNIRKQQTLGVAIY